MNKKTLEKKNKSGQSVKEKEHAKKKEPITRFFDHFTQNGENYYKKDNGSSKCISLKSANDKDEAYWDTIFDFEKNTESELSVTIRFDRWQLSR